MPTEMDIEWILKQIAKPAQFLYMYNFKNSFDYTWNATGDFF